MLETQRAQFTKGTYTLKLPTALYVTLTPNSDNTIKRVAIPIMNGINEKLKGVPSFLQGIVKKIEDKVEGVIKDLLNITDMNLTWKTLHDLYTIQSAGYDMTNSDDFEKQVSAYFNIGQSPGYDNAISILYADFYHQTPLVQMAIGLSLSPQVYVLAMASQYSDGTGQRYDFYHKTIKVYWDLQRSGKMTLCSKSDGTGQVCVDDQLTLKITTAKGAVKTYTHDYGATLELVPTDPVDLSDYLDAGINTVEVTLTNLREKNYGNSNYFIVHT